MKVVMINDCAFVGEVLLKYMPQNIEKQHVKRTRGLWSKTFGLTYSILKAKGDVYHAHYLLQDCYIASRLGKKPLIGHAHGSDLRVSLNHALWGRIVRHNLKTCTKILVSTPDVLCTAKQYREDAEYLPNPVDTELFYPRPPLPQGAKKRVLIASDSTWDVKGTDIAIKALSRIKNKVEVSIIQYGVDFAKTVALASSLGLHLSILPKIPHQELNEHYWNADVILDRFKLGSPGLASLEAIACGRPVVTYVSSEFQQYRNFPLKDVNTEETIINAIREADVELWRREQEYLKKEHDPASVAEKMLNIYRELVE
jgi:glycosyltransferase involved in cell wall biosynthesis